MAYGDDFKIHGPYRRPDNRQIVIVIDRNGDRRTVSYPRFLMELQLGHRIPDDLTIDHWDSNVDNNDISNLRIIPRDQHSSQDTRRVKLVKCKCSWCGKDFERSPRLLRDKAKKGCRGLFCSRKCAGKYARMLQLKLIDKFDVQKAVDSEYYKKKYVTASDIDFDFLDLKDFTNEDSF